MIKSNLIFPPSTILVEDFDHIRAGEYPSDVRYGPEVAFFHSFYSMVEDFDVYFNPFFPQNTPSVEDFDAIIIKSFHRLC